jgi:hypothetical protein
MVAQLLSGDLRVEPAASGSESDSRNSSAAGIENTARESAFAAEEECGRRCDLLGQAGAGS